MGKGLDFSESLLTALEQALEHQHEPKQFVKAALALRAWYRHEALAAKPELVGPGSAAAFKVYGGAYVARHASGELEVYRGRRQAGVKRPVTDPEVMRLAKRVLLGCQRAGEVTLTANRVLRQPQAGSNLSVNWHGPAEQDGVRERAVQAALEEDLCF